MTEIQWFFLLSGLCIYLALGIISFMKWTCMGLIGYVGKDDQWKAGWMTVALIVFWVVPVGWLLYLYVCSLINEYRKRNPKPKLYSCDGKGGKYSLVGEAFYAGSMDLNALGAKPLATSTGAGKSRGETLKLLHIPNTRTILFTGFIPDIETRVFYRDVKTKEVYHRSSADFHARMIRIN